jgi:hypothetical protein
VVGRSFAHEKPDKVKCSPDMKPFASSAAAGPTASSLLQTARSALGLAHKILFIGSDYPQVSPPRRDEQTTALNLRPCGWNQKRCAAVSADIPAYSLT